MAEKSLDDQLKEAEIAKLKEEAALVRKQLNAKWYSGQSLAKFSGFVLTAVALYSVLDAVFLKNIREHESTLIKAKAQVARAALDSLNREKENITITVDSLFLDSKAFRFETRALLRKALKQYRMIKKKDYFDMRLNPAGKGIENKFEQKVVEGDTVIYDAATALTWQGGSKFEQKPWGVAKAFIDDTLNDFNYAGYWDWRLPTLKEVMSLMEAQEVEMDSGQYSLYVDARFKDTPQIWTAYQYHQYGDSLAWEVSFKYGSCHDRLTDVSIYVRAVRSGNRLLDL